MHLGHPIFCNNFLVFSRLIVNIKEQHEGQIQSDYKLFVFKSQIEATMCQVLGLDLTWSDPHMYVATITVYMEFVCSST